jgi:hypothetical protein
MPSSLPTLHTCNAHLDGVEHATPAVARYRSLREFDGGGGAGAGEGEGRDGGGWGEHGGPEPSSYWLHAASSSSPLAAPGAAAAAALAVGEPVGARHQRSHSLNALSSMLDDVGGGPGARK